MFPFQFQFHEDNLGQLEEQRQRDERQAQLLLELRALRGTVPPFDGGVTRRLAAAVAEPCYRGPSAGWFPAPR